MIIDKNTDTRKKSLQQILRNSGKGKRRLRVKGSYIQFSNTILKYFSSQILAQVSNVDPLRITISDIYICLSKIIVTRRIGSAPIVSPGVEKTKT